MNFFISSSNRYLLVFFIFIALWASSFFLASEWLIRTYVEPEDRVFNHFQFFQNTRNPNAAFGDSHVARSFPSTTLANLAYPGDNINTIDYKIRKHYADIAPKTVLLQADPHMFSHYRQTKNDYVDFFKNYNNKTLRISKDYFLENIIEYWRVFIVKGEFRSNISFENNGAQLLSSNWIEKNTDKERLTIARNRVELHTPEENFRSSDFAKKYQKIIEFLKSKEANIILVTFPVSAEYQTFAKNQPEFNEAFSFFEELVEQYDLQYINCFICIQDAALFADEDHLNETGALAFAKEFIEPYLLSF